MSRWQRQKHMLSHVCKRYISFGNMRTLLGGLVCILLLVGTSCAQSTSEASVSPTPTGTNKTISQSYVQPDVYWNGFANVTFAADTTYEQANSILKKAGAYPFPMVNPPCRILREAGALIPESTPMSPEGLKAAFEGSHTMLVKLDTREKFEQVGADPQVVSIKPYPLPKNCPADAPV